MTRLLQVSYLKSYIRVCLLVGFGFLFLFFLHCLLLLVRGFLVVFAFVCMFGAGEALTAEPQTISIYIKNTKCHSPMDLLYALHAKISLLQVSSLKPNPVYWSN